ncbi:MAG TPA: hypothetical protein VHF01_09190 [Candidatus Acidoferrum sp.]|nr:hypothetical protein [Candidatus Acidoferrum sp.]
MKIFKLSIVAVALGLFVLLATFRSAKAQSPQQPIVRQITLTGTNTFQAAVVGADIVQNPEIDPAFDFADDGSGPISPFSGSVVMNRTNGQGRGEGTEMYEEGRHRSEGKLLVSFDGLNHRQQRLANGGNQFSVEPPDQGLCVGNGFVMEAVNDVLNVYDTAGNSLLGVVDLNTFFGYIAAINRKTGAFGPSVTDPSCYFDRATQRWFLVILTLDRVGTTRSLTGTNHLDIAVSQTPSPLGLFNIYRLPVQDDGSQGTPDHACAGGPCLGDYPHIGADANGFYITTNEFNLFAPGFRGSQVYALSKRALASGAATVAVTQFDTANILLDGLPGFTVWPAISPDVEEGGGEGKEFFLSSVAVFSSTRADNRIRVWTLRHTESLDDPSPNLALDSSFVTVNTYAVPPKADQKVGDIPLGDCINDTTLPTPFGPGCWQFLFFSEPAHNEVESNHVDTNDSRMQQVIFADGKLYGALDTAVNVGGATKAGIAFYVIRPGEGEEDDGPRVVRQGVLGLANNNLTYPAIGVTESGRGLIAFTLLGADNFPSAAFATLDRDGGTGPIQIAAAGLGPDDSFTSYKAEVGNTRNRWGDYGAAVADGRDIWIASEYIGQTCTFTQYISAPFGSCGGTRTTLGNWYTRISNVRP